MMELPRRYATPFEGGGRLAPIPSLGQKGTQKGRPAHLESAAGLSAGRHAWPPDGADPPWNAPEAGVFAPPAAQCPGWATGMAPVRIGARDLAS